MPPLLREPLLHFLALGALIFLASAALGGAAPPTTQTILVTEGRVAQLVEAFQRTWQRLPSEAELAGLVQDFVREEIYYREAVLQGLDRDDTVVRRRMRQKLEFLATLQAEAADPTEQELRNFYAAEAQRFREPPEVAFLQVFIDTERRGAAAEAEALRVLAELRALADPRQALQLGDPTLLPAELRLAPLDQVGRSFGTSFALALEQLPLDGWQGPVVSAYGLHLVLLLERHDGRLPPFEEVAGAVAYQWRAALEREILEAQYRALAARYEVRLEGGPASGP